MRSTYYPGVCTKPGTYYQGWFMYMRHTQEQNEEYLLYMCQFSRAFILQIKNLAVIHDCIFTNGPAPTIS